MRNMYQGLIKITYLNISENDKAKMNKSHDIHIKFLINTKGAVSIDYTDIAFETYGLHLIWFQ